MKATELRIGNFVLLCGQAVIVDGLRGDAIFCGVTDDAKQPQPVPLTEEWLLKFGFLKWGRDDMPRTVSYQKYGISLYPANTFSDFVFYKNDTGNSTESARVSILFVHQLQNLYFALTGKELIIK